LQAGDMECAKTHLRQSIKLYPGNGAAAAAAEKTGLDFDELVPTKRLSEAVLSKHTGGYESPDGTLVMTSDDGRLHMKVKNEKHELRATSELDFYAVGLDREYTFVRNASGKTIAVITHFAESDVSGRRLID